MENRKNFSLEWPIAPTFLSLRQGCNEESADYNSDGIYYTDYIRGFLADLSHDENIQNALTIFQFVPKDFLPDDPNAENHSFITSDPEKATVILNAPLDPKIKEILNRQGKKIIRIESGTFVNNGRLCKAFRNCDCDNTSFCFKQDSIVGIFADEQLNTFSPASKEYQQRLISLISEFNLSRDENNWIKCEEVIEKENKRFYLHYTCPYSLFEEHVFPIYVQGRIVACLMLGQMARDSFNRDNSFSCCLEEMKKIDSKCPQYLSDINYLSANDWDKKASAIIKRIVIFENRLEDRIDHRSPRYLHYIEAKFRGEVKKINIKKQDTLSQFTRSLNAAFDLIRKRFDHSEDGFIRMFALPIDIKHEELVLIGWSGVELDNKDDLKFALKQLNDIDNLPSEKQKERILNAASKKIKNMFDESKGDLFFPGWLAGGEIAYIIWKRHDRNLYNQKILFEGYKHALRIFYSVALECYSYIRGTKMELLLETTIQEVAHESAHSILPAIDFVENELNVVPAEMIMPIYPQEFIKYRNSFEKDKECVLDSLNQLREINYSSSLIISPDLQIEKTPEKVALLLYKLKKILSNRACDSHKKICYDQKVSYLEVNIDKKTFNHALFNLLDNAIKYGYEGSYIRIKMNVEKRKRMLNIAIVSYGIGIDSGIKISHLFVRGEEATHMSTGTGIGMYIVKKICKAHGGDITYNSELLSNYNIPMLLNYKHNKDLAYLLSPEEKNKLDEGFSLIPSKIAKEVVCDSSFVKYPRVLSSRINKPTYRNTFCVTLPLS